MILQLAHNISVIWPNQIQRNAHAHVYTNKTCLVINQWNWGVSPRPIDQFALWSTWLEEVLVRPAGGAHPVVCVGPNTPVYGGGWGDSSPSM